MRIARKEVMKKEARCLVCGLIFKKKWGKVNKYCSHKCYWQDMENRKGEESSAWKGDNISYTGVHKWLEVNFTKPKYCEFCGEKNKLEWANISGEYLRIPEDWMVFCHKCHNIWDRIGQKCWRTRRGKKVRMLCGIDFDGVICKGLGIPRKEDFIDCKPVENALSAIKWLISSDIECYVFTARPPKDWKKIVFWLREWGFPGMLVSNIKKNGTAIYIDDRAVRFEDNWQSICKLFG